MHSSREWPECNGNRSQWASFTFFSLHVACFLVAFQQGSQTLVHFSSTSITALETGLGLGLGLGLGEGGTVAQTQLRGPQGGLRPSIIRSILCVFVFVFRIGCKFTILYRIY